MTRVSIYHEPVDPDCMAFHAMAGEKRGRGRTAGEALDALSAQLPKDESGTLVIVQSMASDRFFVEEPRRRLEQLMALKREALALGRALSSEEEADLERLVDAETRATTARAVALMQLVGR